MTISASTALLRPIRRTQVADQFSRGFTAAPDNEVADLLRRIAKDREQVQDVVDKSPSPSIETATALVLYNPFSLDSMMAAALLAGCTKHFSITTQAHHFIDTQIQVGKSDLVIAAGMELSSDEMTRLLEQHPNLKLVLFSYRDGYQWLQSEKTYLKGGKASFWDYPLGRVPGQWFSRTQESTLLRKYKDRITIVRPSSDYYGQLAMRTDNTLTKIAQFWLAEKEHHLHQGSQWALLADLTARIHSQTFPLTSFNLDDEAATDRVSEAAARVKIYDLTVKLRSALASAKPTEKIQELNLAPSVENYRAHMDVVEQTFSRAVHDELLPKVGRGGSYAVRMAQASESTINDLVNALPVMGRDIVFYEDLRRYRVWRFYSPKHGRAQELSGNVKPLAVWSEGLFFCALTDSRAVSV